MYLALADVVDVLDVLGVLVIDVLGVLELAGLMVEATGRPALEVVLVLELGAIVLATGRPARLVELLGCIVDTVGRCALFSMSGVALTAATSNQVNLMLECVCHHCGPTAVYISTRRLQMDASV